jgi:hypothetical protein
MTDLCFQPTLCPIKLILLLLIRDFSSKATIKSGWTELLNFYINKKIFKSLQDFASPLLNIYNL